MLAEALPASPMPPKAWPPKAWPPTALPPCPVTGEPAAALLQMIPAKLLHDLWRHGARVRPSPLRRDAGGIGLYRSACGLCFFHPAEAGDAAFYGALYGRFRAHRDMAAQAATRQDFLAGAAMVRPGDRVLDVGCGQGAFARLVPRARYQGLDPHAAAGGDGPPVLAGTIAAHAGTHAGCYDVACAFQVLEHAADPLRLAADMLRCLRPGGLLVLAMPLWPSALTRLPNNLVNLPPHHLTWWNAEACAALFRVLGVAPVRIGPVAPSPAHAVLHWTERLCPAETREGLFVAPLWRWHLATALAFAAARPLARLAGLPRGAQPIDIVAIGRAPTA